jgi:hypothetical protein
MKYLILISLFSFTLNSNNKIKYDNLIKESYEIAYNPNIKLKWTDFKKINNKKMSAALSTTAITYTISKINKAYEVSVLCVLDKNESYYNGNSNTDYILNHEQRHFDITYIYTCKFINRLKAEPNLNGNTALFIYNQILSEWNSFQDKYDLETNNSINKVEQEKWDKIIDSQLN